MPNGFAAVVAMANAAAAGLPPSSVPAQVPPESAELSKCVDPDGLERTFQRYFEALSGPRVNTDLPGLDSILLPSFRVDVIGRDEAGKPTYFGQDKEEFAHHISEYRRSQGYYHSSSIPEVRCSGPVASASARFVSRNDPNGPVIDRGWIDFNMVRTGDRWRIAHAIWFSERPD